MNKTVLIIKGNLYITTPSHCGNIIAQADISDAQGIIIEGDITVQDVQADKVLCTGEVTVIEEGGEYAS